MDSRSDAAEPVLAAARARISDDAFGAAWLGGESVDVLALLEEARQLETADLQRG